MFYFKFLKDVVNTLIHFKDVVELHFPSCILNHCFSAIPSKNVLHYIPHHPIFVLLMVFQKNAAQLQILHENLEDRSPIVGNICQEIFGFDSVLLILVLIEPIKYVSFSKARYLVEN